MLIVDAANVVGSRPTGWWRDRAGAARALVDGIRAAVADGRLEDGVVVVLEGAGRHGAAEGASGGVKVVHASGEGDETIVSLATVAGGDGTVVSADRALGERVRRAGSAVAGPRWLLDRLDASS